jgi:dihydrofolate reductase
MGPWSLTVSTVPWTRPARWPTGGITACAAPDVAQQYLKADLPDEIHISLVRVLLGGGVRLFGSLEGHQFSLECIRVVESDGVIHLSYRVIK